MQNKNIDKEFQLCRENGYDTEFWRSFIFHVGEEWNNPSAGEQSGFQAKSL